MAIKQSNKLWAIIKPVSFWIFWLLLLECSNILNLGAFVPPSLTSCFYGVIGSIIAFVLTWGYLRTEKLSFRDIGLTFQAKTPLRFLYGIAIGAGIFMVMTALFLVFGKMHLTFTGASTANVLFSVLTFFWLSLMEEVTFRGYPLLKLKDNYGLLWAQLIAAIGFGAYHFAIGWNLQTVLMGPFVWAWVYGLAAIWSRGIALPTGLHMMINVGQTVTGMTSTSSAVWQIDFNSAVHPNLQPVLIGLHLVVFVLAVWLTFVRTRTKQI